MPTPDRLAALLAQVAAGDALAFDALYRATSQKLFGIAIRILRKHELAEEVVQETYVKVWERATQFDPAIGSPITWMAAITRNRALDEVRRKAATPLDEAPGIEEMAGDDEHPLDGLELADEVARLMRCLDGLDNDKRDIVLLAYRQGLTREALAQRFNCPVGTIKTWLRRSLAQLKDCLEA